MKKKASLLIGRWQPFHTGHRALIDVPLKEGKPVVIGIRDTEIDASNPYTVEERRKQIETCLADVIDRVTIVVFPDIDEVCYGRDVGYTIREIRLDEATESISATQIRKDNHRLMSTAMFS